MLFAISAAFGLGIGLTYWFVAHGEATGSTLFAIMTAALVFAAAYAIVAERSANLAGDRPAADLATTAGEDLGIFTTESPWPLPVALCALGSLVGLLWSPFVLGLSLAGLVLCFWRLGSESANVAPPRERKF